MFVKEGREEKVFIEGHPQYKTLNLYDSKMEKQFQGIEKREKQEPDKSQEKKEGQKLDSDEDVEPGKQKSSRKKGMGFKKEDLLKRVLCHLMGNTANFDQLSENNVWGFIDLSATLLDWLPQP